jgi:PAS domain S-box-containing protein
MSEAFSFGFSADLPGSAVAGSEPAIGIREQYRSLFENAPDGIFQTDLAGRYLQVNPALAQIYGYASPAELIAAQPNASGQFYVDPHRRQEFVALMDQQPVIKDFESQIYQQDGSVIWISETCRAVHGANGAVLYYEGFVRDISDRKAAEQAKQALECEQAQMAEALRQSEARNRAMLKAIPDLMFQVNAEGIYTEYLATEALSDLLPKGFSPVGHSVAEYLPTHVLEQRLYYLAKVLSSGQSQIYEQHYEHDDQERFEEVRVVPNGKNEALYMIRDISERKRAEQALMLKHQELLETLEQLQQAKKAAEVASQAKSAFLANMSHELRTPLNGILGYAQVLMRDRSCSPKQQDAVRTIYHCGSHLLTLISDILDLSKIEAQKIEISPQELPLKAFLEDVNQICLIRCEQKQLVFQPEIAGTLPEAIQVDEKRLRQILLNLLSNAIKFTQQGSVTFSVSGSPCPVDPEANLPEVGDCANDPDAARPYQLRFEVIDTGVGIEADDLQRVFQPFEQVGSYARRAEGTGLGLTITQKLIALMGGELSVESELGQGSRFSFELVVPSYLQTQVPSILASNQNVIGYEGRRRTILVVDDRSYNRAVVLGLLEALGFHLIEATNGAEGIEKSLQHKPDLILADLVMPVMDGFEMTRRLRKLEAFQATPIIASSASVFEFDQQRSQEAGYDDFLPKPIEAEDLLNKLAHFLDLVWIREREPAQPADLPAAEQTLVIPPPAELTALYDAAQIGHIEGIIQEAQRLQSLDARFAVFARQVLTLAEQFDDSAIAQLIEPYLSSADPKP